MNTDTKEQNTANREIVITRLMEAPRELVFQAWTDAERVGNWWGPNGFTTTTEHMEVRAGGEWRFVMHGPDGRDYRNRIIYQEVVPPERLVYKHAGDEDVEPVRFHVTVTFVKESGGTRVTLRMVFESKEARDRTEEKYGAVEGGHQTLARLAEYVKQIG